MAVGTYLPVMCVFGAGKIIGQVVGGPSQPLSFLLGPLASVPVPCPSWSLSWIKWTSAALELDFREKFQGKQADDSEEISCKQSSYTFA